jgi:hypothetical protein
MTDFTSNGFSDAGASQGCRIDRTTPLGFIVSHPDCPGTRLTAPNLPTAHALCRHLEALRPRLIPE